MQSQTSRKQTSVGPRRGRYDHDDSLDEAPQLLDDEPADIEQVIPVEENESVEEIEDEEENATVLDERPLTHDESYE